MLALISVFCVPKLLNYFPRSLDQLPEYLPGSWIFNFFFSFLSSTYNESYSSITRKIHIPQTNVDTITGDS